MAIPTWGDAEIQVRLAGVSSVLRRGTPVASADMGSRKARTLVKLLAVERTHVLPMRRIVEVLWAEDPPEHPAENVATLVSRLRRELGAAAVEGGRDGYRLGAGVRVDLEAAGRWTDEAELRLAAGESGLALATAARALDLLVGGSALGDEPDAEWAEPARVEFDALSRRGRHALARAALATGEPARAKSASDDALTTDPYDEEACRLLMRAHQALGEPSRALARYAELGDLLAGELGADPAPETRALHLAILREQPLSEVQTPGPSIPRQQRAVESVELVGRHEELRRLRRSWDAAAAGDPSMVLLVGEAGIGKTRLCDELLRLARATGGTVLFARCYEIERSLFLQPIVEAIASAARRLPMDVVRSVAGATAPALTRLVPDIATVLGELTQERRTSPEIERRRSFEAVTGFIRGLAERAPVLLALDDLHNTGRSTVELLHYLARHAPATRLLIVGTVRTEEGAGVLDPLEEAATRLDVGALPAEAVSKLAADAGRADMAERILQRTSGHALFVVETLRALASGEAGVPCSLRDAVLSRVRRAGRPVEELLRAGAVLGASFDPGTVARLLDLPLPGVVARGEDALTSRLLVASGRDYEFANDLVREVLYATTPEPTRLAYHLQAADLLTNRPEAVAHHASRAGDAPRAARAWLLAGEQALRRFAVEDAEELLSRCLEVTDLAGNLEVRGRALVSRSRARRARAAYREAIADLDAAVLTSRGAGDQRLEMVALRELGGEVGVALGQPIERSTAYLNRGLQIASSLGDRAMEADLLAWLAVIASNRLRFDEAREHARRAVGAARASGDDEALAAALDGLKTSLAYQGEVHELRPVLDELEPLLRRQGDLYLLSWTLFESGFPAVAEGDWPTATACFERALEAVRRSGFAAYESWHLAHLGWLARLQGSYSEALSLGSTAVRLSDAAPNAWCGAASSALLGTTLLETGAVPEAIVVLERGCKLVEEDGSQAYLLRCLGPLAEATGSQSILAEADAMVTRITAPPGSAWMAGDGAYLSVARAWLNRGEPERAREVVSPMLAAARRVPWVAPLADGCLVDGCAAADLGRHDEALNLFLEAAKLAERCHLPRVASAAAAALG